MRIPVRALTLSQENEQSSLKLMPACSPCYFSPICLGEYALKIVSPYQWLKPCTNYWANSFAALRDIHILRLPYVTEESIHGTINIQHEESENRLDNIFKPRLQLNQSRLNEHLESPYTCGYNEDTRYQQRSLIAQCQPRCSILSSNRFTPFTCRDSSPNNSITPIAVATRLKQRTRSRKPRDDHRRSNERQRRGQEQRKHRGIICFTLHKPPPSPPHAHHGVAAPPCSTLPLRHLRSQPSPSVEV